MTFKSTVCSAVIMLAVLISTVFAHSANAGLIEVDYLGVKGGITHDSESNLEWLDLSFTQGMSLSEYNTYLASLNDSWQFASTSLVGDLFTKFGVSSETNSNYGSARAGSGYHYYSSPTNTFMDSVQSLSILGETMSGSSNFLGIKGFTRDLRSGLQEQFMMYHSKSNSIGVISLSNYVQSASGHSLHSFFTYRVKKPGVGTLSTMPINEPTALWLFLCSTLVIVVMRKK